MKFIKISLILSPLIQIFLAKKDNYDFGTRYTDINCTADYVTILLDYCYLKAYTRRLVTANIGVTLPSTLTKPIFVQFIYFYRYGNVYREAMKSPKVDWCEIMEGASENVFITSLMNELKKSVGDFFHKCPYSGVINVKNISSEHEKSAGILWEGQYRIEILVFNKMNGEALKIRLGFQIKSDLKGSFG